MKHFIEVSIVGRPKLGNMLLNINIIQRIKKAEDENYSEIFFIDGKESITVPVSYSVLSETLKDIIAKL